MMDELREILAAVSQYEHLTARSLATTMAVGVVCAMVIYLVYRFFYRGSVYSENFAVLIVLVCCITTFIIITIGANLVLSLGMVGALSIVRFRAAVKDPLDVGFLYWGVAAGLTAGARLYLVALIGTGGIALLYILLTFLRKEKRNYLLILRYATEKDEAAVQPLMQGLRYKLKNKTVTAETTELTVEVKAPANETAFLKPFTSSPDVDSAMLVEFTGDYTG